MKRLVWLLITLAVLILGGAIFAPAQGLDQGAPPAQVGPVPSIPWVTRAFDNSRSGWNTSELTLTQNGVRTRGISLRTIIPLCCDARGMEAQPLVIPNIGGHDIMLLPSMSDDIRAVDAHTGFQLWQMHLAQPILDSRNIDMWQINEHMGCISTGVVSIELKRLYQSCWVSTDGSGSPQSGRYQMFVIDITTGTLVVPPVDLQGQDNTMWKQRASLVLTHTANGGKAQTVFIAHGSVYETSTGYTGGITAFDTSLNEVTAQLPMTSGIWMGGQGLIADNEGYLYATTANGDFDPSQGFYGESFVKVRYTYGLPTVGKNQAKLQVIDQWSPWNDYQRVGKKSPVPRVLNDTLQIDNKTYNINMALPGKISGTSVASEAVTPVGGNMAPAVVKGKMVADVNDQQQLVTRVYPMATGAWADEDWGSAGPACIFELDTCIAAGKDGIGYPINSYHLGQTTAANVGTAANYSKLRAPCVWLTMSPGKVPCDPVDPTKLNFMPNGVTAHLHMTPVHIWDPLLKSWVIFAWGENAALHKWKVSNAGKLSYVTEGREFASADVRNRMPGGMPGGFCTSSSNGQQADTYILACVIPYGDANKTVTNGRLLIYDPIHPAPDGSIAVLWDSQQWGISFKMNKFMSPVINGGDIIVPDYGGRVLVFRM